MSSVLKLLGLEGKLELNNWQREVFAQFLEGFKDDAPQTLYKYALCGAHGVGKTTLGALIILSHLVLCSRCRAGESYRSVVYSGSEKQLKQSLWSEIDLLIQLSPTLQRSLDFSHQKVELRSNRKFAAHARACNLSNIQSLAGVHAENMLIVADEATAISEAAFQKMETFFTSGRAHWLVMANPTTTVGYFYQIFTGENSWYKKVITRFDMNENDVFAREMLEHYGEDSDEYRVRVLGQFPLSEEGSLISRYMIDKARSSDRETLNTAGPYAIGIDTATDEGANYSAYAIVNALRPLGYYREKVRHDDYINVLRQTIDFYSAKGDVIAVVDPIGVGFGLFQTLQGIYAHNRRVKITAIKANEPPKNNSYNLKDRRTEVFFGLRSWLNDVAYLPDITHSQRLYEELPLITTEVSPGSGLIGLTSKKTIGEPIDLADALAFAVSAGGMLAQLPPRIEKANRWPSHLTARSIFAKINNNIKHCSNTNYD